MIQMIKRLSHQEKLFFETPEVKGLLSGWYCL
jgi:hypothetical protein